MVHFTLMSYHYLRYPFTKYLDKMKECGFKEVDLYCVAPQLNPFDYKLKDLLQLDKELKKRDLKPYVLTAENCAYPVNFATSNPVMRESTLRYYQRLIDTAEFLGCQHIQVCPGANFFDKSAEEGWKIQVESLQMLAEYAKRKGVTIFVETCKATTTNLVVTSKDLRRLLDDVGADNVFGLSDTDQMALASEDINDYFDNLGDKYRFVHFSDRNHTVPGTGGLPMKEYYDTLIKRGYEGWASCELCSRFYYEDPDKTTDEYVRFLREELGVQL